MISRKAIGLIALGLIGAVLVGCGKVTPPGKTVLIRKPSGETEVITAGVYRPWGRDRAYFVDNKLQAYTEQGMQILCADDINMEVDVKALLSFNPTAESLDFIQDKVPATRVTEGDITGWELSLDKFYKMAVRPVVRNAAREIISKYNTDDIRINREKITADIDALVRERITSLGFPLEISGILLSNIDYPEVVIQQRNAIKNAQLEDQRKAALAEAQIAQAQREVAIETERAKVRMIRAQAQADENAILTESLTPQFLMWRQLEMLETIGGTAEMMLVPYQAITPDMMNTTLVREAVGRISDPEPSAVDDSP